MTRTWRKHAAPIIARVIAEHQGDSEKDIRTALRAAYPYGERRMWPYKVWCAEVRRQLGITAQEQGRRCREEHIGAGQMELFEEADDETPQHEPCAYLAHYDALGKDACRVDGEVIISGECGPHCSLYQPSGPITGAALDDDAAATPIVEVTR